MRRVYLIRHGLPAFPDGERMCLGITDISLGSQGFAQAEAMAGKLPPVETVFSSPLRRAVETAEALGLPLHILPGLRELSMGDWDGLTFREIRQRYPELYEARGRDRSLPVPGAEDAAQGAVRFRKALEAAAGNCQGDFAVVAHGGVMAAFLTSLGGTGEKPGYAQIIPIGLNAGKFQILEEENHA